MTILVKHRIFEEDENKIQLTMLSMGGRFQDAHNKGHNARFFYTMLWTDTYPLMYLSLYSNKYNPTVMAIFVIVHF